jgi:DNA-binding Xre family transcriptional regulator
MTTMAPKNAPQKYAPRKTAPPKTAPRKAGLPDPSGVLTLDLGEGPRAYALFALDELPARLRNRLAHAAPAAGAPHDDDAEADAQAAAQDVRDARAALAAPREADLPAEVMARLVAGESPLAVLPPARDMTQKDLAARAGLSQAYVSQLAAGTRKGSLDAWRALAEALQVDLELLLPDVA